MKKKNKIRKCRNSNCGLTYNALSKKSVFCCDDCRAEHGRERRQNRDRAFNFMLKNLKKWYLTLLKFESGTIIEMATLKELGLDPAFLPAGRYNKRNKFVFTLGEVLLTQFHDELYEITHDVEVMGDHAVRLNDAKPIVSSQQVTVEKKEDENVKNDFTNANETNIEKETLNKIISDLQAEVIKLRTENQFKMSRDKIERSQTLLALMKKPIVHINELLKLEPVIDTWNGTATIDGAVFKKAFMHQTNYRFINA